MQLGGVVPANVLPFDEDLAIDRAAYAAHLESLVTTTGVSAVTCNGHAGEVASLDSAERGRAVGLATETVAGRVPVIAGVYAENEHGAVRQVRQFEREGADAVLVLPPNALVYDAGAEVAYRQHAAIADASSLPMVVFVYPAWTRMQYDTDTLARICSIPTVTAVKDWSLDISRHEANYRLVASMDHSVSFLTSFSTHLLPALVSGADGILSGHGSVIADRQAQLFGAAQDGDLDRARALYASIQCLTEVVYRSPMANMYARMKEHLAMLGEPIGTAVRPPLSRVSASERDQLRAALEASGLADRQSRWAR